MIFKKIVRKIFFRKKNEIIDKKYIKQIIAKHNPILFEIGSANGDDTLEFISLFQDTNFKLYGFEPEPKNIKIIKEKIHSQNFELFEGVVSDIDGKIVFNRSRTDNPEDLSLSGSIMKPKNHLKLWNWIHFDEQIEVSSVRLDTFVQQKKLDIIDFIWCDVQGAEEKVLLGGQETFKNKVRYFFTEYSNDEQYEGQPNLKTILSLLPTFEIVKNVGTDILLKNKNL